MGVQAQSLLLSLPADISGRMKLPHLFVLLALFMAKTAPQASPIMRGRLHQPEWDGALLHPRSAVKKNVLAGVAPSGGMPWHISRARLLLLPSIESSSRNPCSECLSRSASQEVEFIFLSQVCSSADEPSASQSRTGYLSRLQGCAGVLQQKPAMVLCCTVLS